MKKIILALPLLPVSQAFAQTTNDSIPKNKKGWSLHYQATTVVQSHPSFKASYSGMNSLSDTAEKGILSLTSTFYLGKKLWEGAAVYFNPEMSGGRGFSEARGIAGFPNGETFRIENPAPALYLARLYFQQHIPLPNTSYETIGDNINQVTERIPTSRITITVGKFAISDFFDDNKFSHDPRTQFLNWSLMDNGAWDYPANTRGYTRGFVAELIKPVWAFRISVVQVPTKANASVMDRKISEARGETIEFEKSHFIHKMPGTIRIMAYRNLSQAPSYEQAIDEARKKDSTSLPVFTGDYQWNKYGGIKYGFGISANQDINRNIGAFFRASWNDGKTATWAFTEIDQSISGGVNLNGNLWKRKNDNVGIAFVNNGISKEHRDFFKAGFYGFIIGDGELNYGTEKIAEVFYQSRIFNHVLLSADYQFVRNPGYNKDRGPVHIFGMRCHVEF